MTNVLIEGNDASYSNSDGVGLVIHTFICMFASVSFDEEEACTFW